MQLTDNPHPQLPGGDQSQMFMVYPDPDTGLFPPPPYGVFGRAFQSIDVFLMIMLECQSAVRPVNYK